MREEELIAALLAAAGGSSDPAHVTLGPGDDAAVLLAPPGAELVWTVDDAVEDVHFRRAWGLEAAGHKAAAASLSDLAAMGATPLGALLALTAPRGTGLAQVQALARGLGRALAAAGCPLVGGNLTRGPALALSVSALGAVPRGGAWRRDAARAGDTVWVSGRLGLARAGLLALEGGAEPQAGAPLAAGIAALLGPCPRLDLVAPLRTAGVRAAMDLSDGLCRDLPRLLRRSGLAARIDSGRLPGPDPALAAAVGASAAELAWVGGEDYQLLVTGPPGLGARGPDLTAIGELVAGPPGRITLEGPLAGRAWEGFDHLADG